jgi:hypothetical protein
VSYTCPQGHQSSTGDFCDVCGSPIDAAGSAAPSQPSAPAGAPSATPPPAPSAPSGTPPKPCPNCGAENPDDALFCEDCGYDFATGQLPPPPAEVDPASGLVLPPTPEPGNAPAPSPAGEPELSGVDWVVEVWVDPDWFTSQQADGTCPTSGVPTVVPLPGDKALIGRRSKSRGLEPDIDVSSDGAISHNHAELSRNGEQWSVKDLGSTNGTFVGKPDGTYPSTPITPQQPHVLDDDERIYLGAWTRLVVRRATDQERSSTSS